jgi:tRNA(fMet)-specific endonuclease VapC
VTILLDTNACIAAINRRPPIVRDRVADAHDRGETICVSVISLFELWYGAEKSARFAANAERLAAFMAQFEALSFDEEDSRAAGKIRAALERSGKPIGAYDVLIAGQAIRHAALLVTANAREFARVAGLRCEDWSSGKS